MGILFGFIPITLIKVILKKYCQEVRYHKDLDAGCLRTFELGFYMHVSLCFYTLNCSTSSFISIFMNLIFFIFDM